MSMIHNQRKLSLNNNICSRYISLLVTLLSNEVRMHDFVPGLLYTCKIQINNYALTGIQNCHQYFP